MCQLLTVLKALVNMDLFLLLLRGSMVTKCVSTMGKMHAQLGRTCSNALTLCRTSTSTVRVAMFFKFVLFLLTKLLSTKVYCQAGPTIILTKRFPILTKVKVTKKAPSFFDFFLVLLKALKVLDTTTIDQTSRESRSDTHRTERVARRVGDDIGI